MDFFSGWFKNVVHRDGSDQFLSLELDFGFFYFSWVGLWPAGSVDFSSGQQILN